jgi:nicotinamidase-related amidase
MELSGRSALVIVDMQVGFEDPSWGVRNNPRAELNVARLLTFWRMTKRPVFHIRHDSTNPKSPLRPLQRGNGIKPQVAPVPGEKIVGKKVNSAFIGTTLEADLRAARVPSVVLAGLTTNHCVSTTARMAANLGFGVIVVSDGTAAFSGPGYTGRIRSAQDVHDNALSDLSGEFAAVYETGVLLEATTAE